MNGTEARPGFPRDRALPGRLFESLVIQSVRVYAQARESCVRHLRLQGSRREIDQVVERADQRVLALEVKLAARVDDGDVRNLLWQRDQFGDGLLDAPVDVLLSRRRASGGRRRAVRRAYGPWRGG